MQLTPDQLNVLLASTAIYSLIGGIVFCLAWHVTLAALVLVREGVLALARLVFRRDRPVPAGQDDGWPTRPEAHRRVAL